MLIVNRDKERIKSYLYSDMDNICTALLTAAADIKNTIRQTDNVLGGSSQNHDKTLIDICLRSLAWIDSALEEIRWCRSNISELDEWEDTGDDE